MEGEGVGWLKLNRLKKLMEDESYRSFVVSKLNKTLDKKIAPDDHIDDVVSKTNSQTTIRKAFKRFLVVHIEGCLERDAQSSASSCTWFGSNLR